jgi:hypothetical protein
MAVIKTPEIKGGDEKAAGAAARFLEGSHGQDSLKSEKKAKTRNSFAKYAITAKTRKASNREFVQF